MCKTTMFEKTFLVYLTLHVFFFYFAFNTKHEIQSTGKHLYADVFDIMKKKLTTVIKLAGSDFLLSQSFILV